MTSQTSSDLLCAAAAQRTIAHHVRVEMTATAALDRVRGVVFRHQQVLHFAHFERTQHTPQAGDAVAVAFGLAKDFIDQFMPMLIE